MPRASKWINTFERFIAPLRIDSKEVEGESDGRGAKLDLWGSQRRFLEEVAAGLDAGVRTFVCLKSRQLGISTVSLAIDLFWLAMHPGMQGALVADNDSNSAFFRAALTRYIASFPKDFFGADFRCITNNRNFLKFSNGSRLDFLVAGKSKKAWSESRGYTLAHACLAPGTPVVLEHGRIKPIEDVSIGDRVLTHTGAAATVVDVCGQPNTKGPMLRFQPWLGDPVLCTEDHTIPTQRGILQAKDVALDDWLVMPVRQITEPSDGVHVVALPSPRLDRGNNQGPAGAGAGCHLLMNEEVGYAIGYYLAEGSITFNAYDGRACGLIFARHRDERDYANRAIAALQHVLSGSRRTHDRPGTLTSTEAVYGTPFAVWLNEAFGAKERKAIPDAVFGWGRDFCRGLLCGLLAGDGSKKAGVGEYAHNVMVLPTIHSSLAMQARDIAAALGCGWASVKYRPAEEAHGRICKPQWRVCWAGAGAAALRELLGLPLIARAGHDYTNKWRIEGGLVLLRIRAIDRGFDEPEMWDISVDHADHTFRTPSMGVGNTEVSKYGTIEGLASFRESLAEAHPNRLFIYESTAAGFNHWRDMWISAGNDPHTQRRFFIGWWAKDINSIKRRDKRYAVYAAYPPDERERELIKAVSEKHNHNITMEQLAWMRWRQSEEAADPNLLDQNQPWIAEQAFIQSGYSFFQARVIQQEMQRVYDTADGLFKGYRFWIGNDFWATKLEQIGSDDRINEVELRIWQEPVKEGRYVIGCDPAYGRNDWKDRHGITVCRCYADKIVQVAEYADHNIETRQAAWVLAYLAGAYKNCLVSVELGGPGRAIFTEFEYLRRQVREEIYNQKAEKLGWEDFLSTARWYLYHKPDSPGAGFVYSWETNTRTKFEIMNQLRDSFMTRTLLVHSIPALEEMASVIQDGSEIAAPGRNKDDRVFALALCNRAWIDHVRSPMLSEGLLYERVLREEAGERGRGGVVVDRIVYDWFRRQEEVVQEPEVPQWMRIRGLA